jgi:hypothetical protein
MKFTTPCFVRVEDAEKRTDLFKWLFDRGYAGRYQINMANSIIVVGLEDGCVDVAHCNTSDGLAAYGLIDCGENIGLFKALAAMNDENDNEQYFVTELAGSSYCVHKNRNTNLAYSLTCRKATVAEIIEYFKKREK